MADLVLWKPAFFGVKPSAGAQGRLHRRGADGRPQRHRSRRRSRCTTGRCSAASAGRCRPPRSSFVSQAALDERHRRRARPGEARWRRCKGCRTVKKADMVHNDYLPAMEIDAQTYEVRADGQLLTCDPATRAADGAAVLPVLTPRGAPRLQRRCSPSTSSSPGPRPGAGAAQARASVELDWDVRQKSRFDATDSSRPHARRVPAARHRGARRRRAGGRGRLAGRGAGRAAAGAGGRGTAAEHGSAFDLLRAAYHLGNRHVPLELQPDHLKLEPDHVLAEMLRSHAPDRAAKRRRPSSPRAAPMRRGTAHGHARARSRP